MKTGIIVTVGLYQRGVVLRGGREREQTWRGLRPVGGWKRQSVIKSPYRDGNISSLYILLRWMNCSPTVLSHIDCTSPWTVLPHGLCCPQIMLHHRLCCSMNFAAPWTVLHHRLWCSMNSQGRCCSMECDAHELWCPMNSQGRCCHMNCDAVVCATTWTVLP